MVQVIACCPSAPSHHLDQSMCGGYCNLLKYHHWGCLNNPIFRIWGCAAWCTCFMWHYELWATLVSHPFSSFTRFLGLAGRNMTRKSLSSKFAVLSWFPYILSYHYVLVWLSTVWFVIAIYGSIWELGKWSINHKLMPNRNAVSNDKST